MLFELKRRAKLRTLWALPYDKFIAVAQPVPDPKVVDLYNKTGFAFIHIPKCAGTSIEHTLYGYSIKHRTWRELRDMNPEAYEGWFKFAVLRNPLDRFLSSTSYLLDGGRNPYDREFSRRIIRGQSPSDFAKSLANRKECQRVLSWFHFRPQSEYVSYQGEIKIDKLFLFDDLGEVSELIKKPLPHLNTTQNRSQSEHLDEEAESILRRIYADDFRLYEAEKKKRSI